MHLQDARHEGCNPILRSHAGRIGLAGSSEKIGWSHDVDGIFGTDSSLGWLEGLNPGGHRT
jgi:hypothetical protein